LGIGVAESDLPYQPMSFASGSLEAIDV
jgi:hypothetical protein